MEVWRRAMVHRTQWLFHALNLLGAASLGTFWNSAVCFLPLAIVTYYAMEGHLLDKGVITISKNVYTLLCSSLLRKIIQSYSLLGLWENKI